MRYQLHVDIRLALVTVGCALLVQNCATRLYGLAISGVALV